MKKLEGVSYLWELNWKSESDLLYRRPYGYRYLKYDEQQNFMGETQRVMRDVIGIKHGKGFITLLTDEEDQDQVRKTIARIRAENKVQETAASLPSQGGAEVACFAMIAEPAATYRQHLLTQCLKLILFAAGLSIAHES